MRLREKELTARAACVVVLRKISHAVGNDGGAYLRHKMLAVFPCLPRFPWLISLDLIRALSGIRDRETSTYSRVSCFSLLKALAIYLR